MIYTAAGVNLNADPEIAMLRAEDAMRAHMDEMAAVWPTQGSPFAIDTETATVRMTFGGGRVAIAHAQILGGFIARGSAGGDPMRFQWAWADPSVPPRLRLAAEALRGFGQVRRLRELTDEGVQVNRERLGRYAGLACALGHGVAMLAGPVDAQPGLETLLVIGQPQLI